MTTQTKLQQQSQQLEQLEKQLAAQRLKQRKADTRHKIELGGLVIKAKMAGFAKDIILGALIDAKMRIEQEPETIRLFQSKGHHALMGFDKP